MKIKNSIFFMRLGDGGHFIIYVNPTRIFSKMYSAPWFEIIFANKIQFTENYNNFKAINYFF